MYTKCIQNVCHIYIYISLYMNFVFTFKRTMAAKFCIKSGGCILYAKIFKSYALQFAYKTHTVLLLLFIYSWPVKITHTHTHKIIIIKKKSLSGMRLIQVNLKLRLE